MSRDMNESRKPKQHREVQLEPASKVTLLPPGFWNILFHRYFPVLGLTYAVSVVGIAAKRSGSFIENMFLSAAPYEMALFVAVWVSVPAVLWILLNGMAEYRHVADDWFKIAAGVMTSILLVSFILFPEISGKGLRIYLVATIPVLIVQYLFFVKGGLPAFAAHTLSIMGLVFLCYGAMAALLF